jgi:predicted SnoaL-like aldol condensation-catalyzing enzyme
MGFQIKEAVAMSSPAEPRRAEMNQSRTQKTKAFVLEAFETRFNKKDFVAAEKFWSSNYIQHSAHIPQGATGSSA